MAVTLVAVYPMVVFSILVTFDEKLDTVDDCHLTILPVYPLKIKLVELVPLHTVVLPDILPPTLAGFTMILSTLLFTGEQTPLVTTAL